MIAIYIELTKVMASKISVVRTFPVRVKARDCMKSGRKLALWSRVSWSRVWSASTVPLEIKDSIRLNLNFLS